MMDSRKINELGIIDQNMSVRISIDDILKKMPEPMHSHEVQKNVLVNNINEVEAKALKNTAQDDLNESEVSQLSVIGQNVRARLKRRFQVEAFDFIYRVYHLHLKFQAKMNALEEGQYDKHDLVNSDPEIQKELLVIAKKYLTKKDVVNVSDVTRDKSLEKIDDKLYLKNFTDLFCELSRTTFNNTNLVTSCDNNNVNKVAESLIRSYLENETYLLVKNYLGFLEKQKTRLGEIENKLLEAEKRKMPSSFSALSMVDKPGSPSAMIRSLGRKLSASTMSSFHKRVDSSSPTLGLRPPVFAKINGMRMGIEMTKKTLIGILETMPSNELAIHVKDCIDQYASSFEIQGRVMCGLISDMSLGESLEKKINDFSSEDIRGTIREKTNTIAETKENPSSVIFAQSLQGDLGLEDDFFVTSLKSFRDSLDVTQTADATFFAECKSPSTSIVEKLKQFLDESLVEFSKEKFALKYKELMSDFDKMDKDNADVIIISRLQNVVASILPDLSDKAEAEIIQPRNSR